MHTRGQGILGLAMGALLVASLAGCGGGGGGGGNVGGPNPPATPPVARTLGGSIAGLEGTVVLQNNGGNNLSITSNGSFSFASSVNEGSAYQVTVLTQPTWSQCTVSNGQGTVAGNVTTVSVSCAYVDRRAWGTAVRVPVPADAGVAEAADAAMLPDGGLLFGGSFRNFGPSPDTLTLLTARFDPSTRMWGEISTLSAPGSTDAIQSRIRVAAGTQGSLVAWQQPNLLRGGLRSNSGTWSTPAWSGQHRIDVSDSMRSVVTDIGNIYLVWDDFDANATPQRRLLYRFFNNGTWSNPLIASTQYATVNGGFRLASDGTRVRVVWVTPSGGLSSCTLGTQACENTTTVPTSGTARLTEFHLRRDGNALVLWTSGNTRFANVFDGTTWSSATDVGAITGGTVTLEQIVALPSSFLLVGRFAEQIQVREYRTSWGAWQPRGSKRTVESADAVADAAGNVLLAWHDQTSVTPAAYALNWSRYDAASAQWSATQTYTTDLGPFFYQWLKADARGNVLMIWYRVEGVTAVMMASLFDGTTRQWGTAVRLGDDAYDPNVYFDSAQRAVALWLDRDGEWVANSLTFP